MNNTQTRQWKDRIAQQVMVFLCLVFILLIGIFIFGLYERSKPVLALQSLNDLLFSNQWHPTQGHFGLAGFITGTLWVTFIAIILAGNAWLVYGIVGRQPPMPVGFAFTVGLVLAAAGGCGLLAHHLKRFLERLGANRGDS